MQVEIAWADAVDAETKKSKKVVIVGLQDANNDDGMLQTNRILDLPVAQGMGQKLIDAAEADPEGQHLLEFDVGTLSVVAELTAEQAKAVGGELIKNPTDIQVATPDQLPPDAREPERKGNGGGLILPGS